MPQLMFSARKWLGQAVLLLSGLAIAVSLGCGSSKPTGTVKGTVTLNGAPYADAGLVFLSMETGQGGAVDIQAGGTFELAEPLPTGTYTVYLSPKAAEAGDQPKPVSIDRAVPDKYWNEASSDLKIEVKEGENTVPLDLKK